MADNRKRKVGPDGRNEFVRYVRLEDTMTRTPAWRALSGNAIKVYIALSRFYVGNNNGSLFFSVDLGAQETGLSPNTVNRCLNELEALGFIKAVQKGYFKQKGGPGSVWRLTHWDSPHCRLKPTKEYLRWQPPESGNKTRSQKMGWAVAKLAMRPETPLPTVANIETGALETPLVSVDPNISNFETQVICHGHGAAKAGKQAANSPKIAGGVSVDAVDPASLDELRNRVRSHLERAGVGGLTRLAGSVPMQKGTLSKFVNGGGLNRTHFINLQLALGAGRKAA